MFGNRNQGDAEMKATAMKDAYEKKIKKLEEEAVEREKIISAQRLDCKLQRIQSDSVIEGLRKDLKAMSNVKDWELEKARNEVRKDLESKCVEADLRMVRAEARADFNEKALNEYKIMVKTLKTDPSEKIATKAMEIALQAAKNSEVNVSVNKD